MSEGKRSIAPDADDLVHAPFLDEAERSEFEWLLARESNPSAPAPSGKIAGDYAELEELLATLPARSSDDSWQQDVLRATRTSAPPPAPWWRRGLARWTLRSTVVAAAAALVLLFFLPPPPRELEVEIVHRDDKRSQVDPKRGNDSVVLGDHLVVVARPDGAADLRVYRSDGKLADGTLVARCPDGPSCRTSTHGKYIIDVELDAPVEYRVILVVGMSDATVTAKDAFVDAARAANARIITYPPLSAH